MSHRALTRPPDVLDIIDGEAAPSTTFARVVEQALDMLGVEPGQTFIVAAKPVVEKPEARAKARAGDPSTSQKAAKSITQVPGKQRAVARTLARYGPMADHELVDRYEELAAQGAVPSQTPQSIRSRRSELVDDYTRPLVRDTGRTRITAAGNAAVVWELTWAGQGV